MRQREEIQEVLHGGGVSRNKSHDQKDLRERRGEDAYLFAPDDRCLGKVERDRWEDAVSCVEEASRTLRMSVASKCRARRACFGVALRKRRSRRTASGRRERRSESPLRIAAEEEDRWPGRRRNRVGGHYHGRAPAAADPDDRPRLLNNIKREVEAIAQCKTRSWRR